MHILIIDNQANVQKRKRAETITEDCIIVDTTQRPANQDTDDEFDDGRHGLPSNEEDDPDDSDVDQPDEEPLTESTLFWSDQLIISRQEDHEIGLGKPTVKHQMSGTLSLLRIIFIY